MNQARTHFIFFGFALFAMLIIGCRADLLPVGWGSEPGPYRFCMKDVNADLVVVIKNQGSADAPATITEVAFAIGGTVTLPTPAIPANDSVDLRVTIPPECFIPECGFRITADVKNQVAESDETNNVEKGICKP
jgi:hypothetical protein